MSSYKGTFTVTNAGTGSITGSVSHSASGQEPTTCSFSNLGPGQTTPPVPYYTESSSVDQWYYDFTRNGTSYQGDKDCGIETEDSTVSVSLTNSQIIIAPNESSSCSSGLDTAS